MVSTVSQSVSYGFSTFAYFVSLISINVGVFNLLPIPALDGCRFLFLLVEAVRRKPTRPEVEGMVHFVGFALMMVLMLVVTVNDVMRLANGG
ncbi:MAG: site-2 protease family protein [Oscillospiraceae bacterium]